MADQIQVLMLAGQALSDWAIFPTSQVQRAEWIRGAKKNPPDTSLGDAAKTGSQALASL